MSDRLAGDLAILVEMFASGGYREISVRSAGLTLLLSTDGDAVAKSSTAGPGSASVTPPVGNAAAAPPRSAAAPASGPVDPSWWPVVAPNLGTFYRSPKPGAAPFVEVGTAVEAGDEVCLLEVMKLFTSVKAGIAGTVRHVAARDAELVEGGQILFHIESRER